MPPGNSARSYTLLTFLLSRSREEPIVIDDAVETEEYWRFLESLVAVVAMGV